jgi:hypothetical protein
MEKKSVFSVFMNWLSTTEIFARPSKQLSGKWQLFEYFFEPEGELINIKEHQLKAEKQYWEIEFVEDKCKQMSNLTIQLINEIENGNWETTKNFITLIHAEDFRRNVEFQFAIEKGILKLLRKDAFGKIEFFGFFRKLDSK